MLITLCHIDLRCGNTLCVNVMAIWMIVDNFFEPGLSLLDCMLTIVNALASFVD